MAIESQLTRRTAILAALEGTYGQDAGPTSALNGILVNEGVDLTPQADKSDRTVVRDTFSPAGSVIGAKSQDIKIQVEVRGGGLDAEGHPLPPDYDSLLLASGMQRSAVMRLTMASNASFLAGETITGGTSGARGTIEYIERDKLLVATMLSGTFAAETITGGASGVTATVAASAPGIMYRPITARPAAQVSDSIYFHKDSILHRLLGARGTWSLDAQDGKIATIDFTMSGLWVDPADQDMPAPVLTNLAGPQFMGANLQIGEYTPAFTALKLDIANKVEKRQDANSPEGIVGLLITGRSPTGSLDPEVDKLAAYNPWTAWRDTNARAKLCGYIGSVPGNRLAVYVGAAQYTDLKYGERVGLAIYNETFTPTQERTGDDELRLVFF